MNPNKQTHKSILPPSEHTRSGDAAHDAQQPRAAIDKHVDKEYHRAFDPLSLGEKVAIGVVGTALVAGLAYGGVRALEHKQPGAQDTATIQPVNNHEN